MTRSTIILALVGLSANAFAAAPHPTAVDADRDGAFEATIDVNADGNLDHLDIGVRSRDYDCDDAHSTVSPRLIEVVGDGIDNDCSGADAVYPVADAVAKRYLANSGTAGPIAFIVEYAACSAAIECDVDDVGGTMKINAAGAETHVFQDVYVNGGKVLRNSGQRADGREVVTIDEAQHFRGATGSGGGVGKTYVDKSAEALREEADRLREEMLIGDDIADRRLDAIESGNDVRDGEINRLADVDYALEGRIAATESTYASIMDDIVGLEAADRVLTDSVDAASAHGPLIEAGAVAGGLFRRPLNESGGDPVRGSAIGGGGFELRAGVDAQGWQTAGWGQLSFGSDGQGTGPDTALVLGADVVLDTGFGGLGPWAAYLRTEDHAHLLAVSVIENGGLVGVTLQGDVAKFSAARIVPFARLGAGVGYYGTKGSTEDGTVVVSQYGGLGLLQAGIRFGAGALQD